MWYDTALSVCNGLMLIWFCHCFHLEGTRNCAESDEIPLPMESSANSTVATGIIAAITMSIVVVIAMIGMIVLIHFYCRKSKQLKESCNVLL